MYIHSVCIHYTCIVNMCVCAHSKTYTHIYKCIYIYVYVYMYVIYWFHIFFVVSFVFLVILSPIVLFENDDIQLKNQ